MRFHEAIFCKLSFGIFCLLAGLAKTQADETVFTNLLQLRLAAQLVSATNGGLQLEGVIYDLSAEKRLLALRDESDLDVVEVQSLPVSLRPGQRIRIILKSCRVAWQRTRLHLVDVTASDIRVMGEQVLSPPNQFYIGQVLGAFGPNQWISMEGQARFVSTRSGGQELELRSPGGSRLDVELPVKSDLPEVLLLNSRLRVTGVGINVLSRTDQRLWGVLIVLDPRKIQVVEAPLELWSAYPELSPDEISENTNELVHVAGMLESAGAAGDVTLRLRCGEREIFLDHTREAVALVGREVEALGVLHCESSTLFLRGSCVRARSAALPVLATAEQVLRLKRDEAAAGYPVVLRGVITSVLPNYCQNFVLQDSTRGIFIQTTNLSKVECPRPGEFWEVRGVSGAGYFSPMVFGQKLKRLGAGRFPEPLSPAWDQLINGSLDNQFVEIAGIITDFKTNSLTLLTHWGKISVSILDQKLANFMGFENKLVRLRGCFKAVWDDAKHELIIGVVRLDNATINADKSLSVDPFATPEKSLGELRQFDLQAGAFQRVHLRGQIVARRRDEFFLMSDGLGLRFIANAVTNLIPGDLVQIAGYPELGGPSPVLRETVVKKNGHAPLPAPKDLAAEDLLAAANDSLRVVIEGTLVRIQAGRNGQTLEVRSGLRNFLAWLPDAGSVPTDFVLGSRLRLTGVFAGQSGGRAGDEVLDSFDLLISSPADILVLSRPPWWTFKKLLIALATLAGGLALAGVWILVLRRQVERRTAQLERANRQREQAERARVLDEERLRIARDLHDDLGSSLTEITMLGSMSLAEKENLRGDTLSQITKKARDSVNALDVIVWAVNPKENSLQSLADYLASYADEFLTASGLGCRLNLPVSFPVVTLDGRIRHDLFLATKEALNNAVRHARATEVELSLTLENGMLYISVRDNGVGFARPTKSHGHGLDNLQSRLAKIGGECQIESVASGGTNVVLKLVLPAVN